MPVHAGLDGGHGIRRQRFADVQTRDFTDKDRVDLAN
jgi:hypothetical protein